MLMHPDKQAKAQEELDRVVGYGRIPERSDEPNLPYLSAILKEVLRLVLVEVIFYPSSLNLLILSILD